MLTKMKNENDERFQGPGQAAIPLYAGIGYRFFKLLRINFGAAFTRKVPAVEGPVTSTIVRPWAGLALDLSYGLFKGFSKKHPEKASKEKK